MDDLSSTRGRPARDMSAPGQNKQTSENKVSSLTSAPTRVPVEAWYIDLRTDLQAFNQKGQS